MNTLPDNAGLRYWARAVIQELQNVTRNFDADPVHDLRVAMRRCRSLADGFAVIDPDPGWKYLKKSGRELFRSLGELRDVQVMEEWLIELSQPDDLVREALLKFLVSTETELKKNAQTALRAFDTRNWDSLSEHLSRRTSRVPPDGLVFQHLALERWQQARELHHRALRNRSAVALHQLRIGIKKFRYTVENFLPQRHENWGEDLKKVQDLLGEIHDLDVFRETLRNYPGIEAADRERWEAKITESRQKRLENYREKMLGPKSLWHVWRAGLPKDDQLQAAALTRLQTWAEFLDPDFQHSKRVSELAIQLYDGLEKGKVLRRSDKARRILHAAALLHNVGLARSKRGHHKESYRLIRGMAVPLGWSPQELNAVAAVVRYHRGALPHPERKSLKRIPASARDRVIRLAAVLRLADELDCTPATKVRQLAVERTHGTVVVRGQGYVPLTASAQRIAAARHLLEATCDVAVVVRPS